MREQKGARARLQPRHLGAARLRAQRRAVPALDPPPHRLRAAELGEPRLRAPPAGRARCAARERALGQAKERVRRRLAQRLLEGEEGREQRPVLRARERGERPVSVVEEAERVAAKVDDRVHVHDGVGEGLVLREEEGRGWEAVAGGRVEGAVAGSRGERACPAAHCARPRPLRPHGRRQAASGTPHARAAAQDNWQVHCRAHASPRLGHGRVCFASLGRAAAPRLTISRRSLRVPR